MVWHGVVWCGVVWCGVLKALLAKGNGRDGLAYGLCNPGGLCVWTRAVCSVLCTCAVAGVVPVLGGLRSRPSWGLLATLPTGAVVATVEPTQWYLWVPHGPLLGLLEPWCGRAKASVNPTIVAG